MTDHTPLVAGQTEADSSDIVVTDGHPVMVQAFAENVARLPHEVVIQILRVDADKPYAVDELSAALPIRVLTIPGTYRLRRADISHHGVGVGVRTDA